MLLSPSFSSISHSLNPTTAAKLILLNSGESSSLNDTTVRIWIGDERSTHAPPNTAAISSAYRASYMHPAVFPVPYQTTRIFHSPFTYTFPVTGDSIFLRLYFYPDFYSSYNTSHSFFSLTANSFSHLSNFSAFLHCRNSSQPSLMKEFVVNVAGELVLTLSISDKLYFRGNDMAIKFVDQVNPQLFYLDNNTALENLYRLNVGGAAVDISDDSGMFRSWSPDDDFIYFADFGWTDQAIGDHLHVKYTAQTPPSSAPATVYKTFREMTDLSISLEWGFPIDSGFYYLLRLHFCEFTEYVTKVNQRVFTISINNQTVM